MYVRWRIGLSGLMRVKSKVPRCSAFVVVRVFGYIDGWCLICICTSGFGTCEFVNASYWPRGERVVREDVLIQHACQELIDGSIY